MISSKCIFATKNNVDFFQISQLNGMDSDSVWFVSGNVSHLDSLTNITLNSNFYMFETHQNFISIYEVYRKSDYLPLISKIWGIWTQTTGLVYNEGFIWSRRRDLTGHYP